MRKVVVGHLDNNCYWFSCKRTGEAVLIDLAGEPERLAEAGHGLDVKMALITHGHWDHIQGADGFRSIFGVPIGIHAADASALGDPPDFTIEDGRRFEVGDLALEAIHTPGHTPGGMCFRWEGFLFAGDTLFPGGPGSTRGNKDDFKQIVASIESRLFTLSDSTIVMPGHGSDTTIGAERPHLGEWIKRGW